MPVTRAAARTENEIAQNQKRKKLINVICLFPLIA